MATRYHCSDCRRQSHEQMRDCEYLIPRTFFFPLCPWHTRPFVRTQHDNGIICYGMREEPPSAIWKRITWGFGTDCVTFGIICQGRWYIQEERKIYFWQSHHGIHFKQRTLGRKYLRVWDEIRIFIFIQMLRYIHSQNTVSEISILTASLMGGGMPLIRSIYIRDYLQRIDLFPVRELSKVNQPEDWTKDLIHKTF